MAQILPYAVGAGLLIAVLAGIYCYCHRGACVMASGWQAHQNGEDEG